MLRQQILDAHTALRKGTDGEAVPLRKNLTEGLVVAIQAFEKKEKRQATDTDILVLVQTEMKKREQAVDIAEKGMLKLDEGSKEWQKAFEYRMANQYEHEELSKWLPKQLTKEELEAKVAELVDPTADKVARQKQLGAVLKHFKDTFAGQYDSQTLVTVTKTILAL